MKNKQPPYDECLREVVRDHELNIYETKNLVKNLYINQEYYHMTLFAKYLSSHLLLTYGEENTFRAIPL